MVLEPPATRRDYAERIGGFQARGGVFPVAYPQGGGRSEMSRRLVTADLRVRLSDDAADEADFEKLGLVVKDRPAYAPGWLVLAAESPLAALDALAILRGMPGVGEADVLFAVRREKKTLPNDPLATQQWHLKRTASSAENTDVNVTSVWNYGGAGGVLGSGVRIGIVDDGLQQNHPDLSANVDTGLGWDWIGNDGNPSPFYSSDIHGTACAGVAAARGNNGIGVSGVAPEATLVGMRLVSGSGATDAQEASAMAYLPDAIEIKSNSWGPPDGPVDADGTGLEAPGPLTRSALASATSTGRGGKGTIFVWAAGNGHGRGDNSNYDGYANSIHTIAVSAHDSTGRPSVYSEAGANTVVSAPSSGGELALDITTTDRTGFSGYNNTDYYSDFGGTSSATPVVSGVVALMLEKNPELGWRDVQEILIRSAFRLRPEDPAWMTNGAGLSFHSRLGAGKVDAAAAVALAENWVNLGAWQAHTSTQSGLNVSIPENNAAGITRTFNVASNLRVEHVTLRLSATHTARGNLEITLTSPSGKTSRLADVRVDTNDHYNDWTFSSVRHWGESATGAWTLKVADRSGNGNTTGGTLTLAELKLHGSTPVAPVITSAQLSAGDVAFADEPLSVQSVSSSDPQGDPVTYSYQWQSGTDGVSFSPAPGKTSVTLPVDAAHAGKLWRCVITPTDGTHPGIPYTTMAVNLVPRPQTTAHPGDAYAYESGLVLRGAGIGVIDRIAIINEFSQGSAANREWVELLMLRTGSLAYWDLKDSTGSLLIFRNSSVWDNIPAGTRVVIYNGGTTKDASLPRDSTSPSDGVMVISSTNTTYFQSGSWPGFNDTGDAVLLNDEGSRTVHALSYGAIAHHLPQIGPVGSGMSVRYGGGSDAGADLAENWSSASAASATPGAANNAENAAFISRLAAGDLFTPSAFRVIGSLPTGLSLDEETGVISGSLDPELAEGDHEITIERYNAADESIGLTFTLEVTPVNDFANWIARHEEVGDKSGPNDDPDGDGLPNAIENFLGSSPLAPNAGLTDLAAVDGDFIFRHTRTNEPVIDREAGYEWSVDLENWHAAGATVSGVTVEIVPAAIEDNEAPENDLLEVTASVTGGPVGKLFIRLRSDAVE